MFRVCLLAWITACTLLAQLPQGVTAAEWSAVLAKARLKILESVQRITNFTCLETIDRAYMFGAPTRQGRMVLRVMPEVCSAAKFQADDITLLLDSRDRVRVEVAVAGGEEIHSWPAASQFDTRPIDKMIPVGPTSTGAFGGTLVDIFNNPGARFSFEGRVSDGHREVFEFTFRVPLAASHYAVNTAIGFRTTAYRGSFQVDRVTGELLRMVDEIEDPPPGASMCRARTATDYAQTAIGDATILLPSKSVLETLRSDLDQTRSVTVFSACHEYVAQSAIHFDDADDAGGGAKKTLKAGEALPPGLSLTLALREAIDASNAAGGDPVSAKVVKAVRAKGSNRVLIPAGAIARGRILEFRNQVPQSRYLMSIRFDTLESQDSVSPLSVQPAKAVGKWIVFPGKQQVIRAGFETSWVTEH